MNKLSLQSFYHISNVEPSQYVHKISPRALLYLAAVEDALTGPLENHKKVLEKLGSSKNLLFSRIITFQTPSESHSRRTWVCKLISSRDIFTLLLSNYD